MNDRFNREGVDVVDHFNHNAQQEQVTSDACFEAPGDLPPQAYAKALYPFKGENSKD